MSQKVTPKQRKAVYMLAEGLDITSTAKQLKIRRETLSRWKKLPHFQQEIERVAAEMRGSFQQQLTGIVSDSITVIGKDLKGYLGYSDSSKTALNVLKLLKIEHILSPNVPKQAGNATEPAPVSPSPPP